LENLFASLRTLSEKSRFNLVRLLLQHDYCVEALAKRLEMSESAVSQHLKVLQEHELVDSERRGYYAHYSVRKDRLKKIGESILSLTEIEQEKTDCCKGEEHKEKHHGKHSEEDCCKGEERKGEGRHKNAEGECCKGHH